MPRSLLLLLSIVPALSACSASTSTPSPAAHDDAGVAASDAGSTASVDDAGPANPGAGGATAITGSLGALGAAKSTVSSLWISNSGESLIYMSSAPITCATLANSRWLGSVASGAQVVEVVLKGAPAIGTLQVPPAEVNYAQGGKSSAYEVTASSGSLTFTKAEAKGVVEGSFSATYDSGDSLSGTFHADFCSGGQGY